jgi:hypothetical protein
VCLSRIAGVLFQEKRCVFPGEEVCLSRRRGVSFQDSKSEGCAFPGELKKYGISG